MRPLGKTGGALKEPKRVPNLFKRKPNPASHLGEIEAKGGNRGEVEPHSKGVTQPKIAF